MSSLLKTTLGLVVALLICFQLANSQQTEASKTDADAALREKAFATLASLADQLGSLQSPENRARIGANIAESLWRHDEKRARALFQLVHEDIKLGLQKSPDDDQVSERTFRVFLKLREDTLRRIAKYDAELAVALFRDGVPPIKRSGFYSAEHPQFKLEARERAFEMELAKAAARQKPEAALSLARKSLANGFDDGLVQVLLQLSAKRSEDARLLHREIVSKIGETDFKLNQSAAPFSVNLAVSFLPPAADETTYKNLIEILLTAAETSECGTDDQIYTTCFALGRALSQMQRHFPTRAARLKLRLYRSNATGIVANPEARYQLNDLRQNGTIDEMLALATKYPEFEGEILSETIRRAEWTGDFERAQKIADNYRGSSEVRQQLQERVANYPNNAAKIEAYFSNLQGQLPHIPREMQFENLIAFANHAAPIDRKYSLKALAQANALLETAKTDRTHYMRGQIIIAAVYCLVQSDQGFAMMEALVPTLNELISAGAKLDGFDTRYLRDGEWNMSAEGEVGNLLNIMANNASHFAWYDFERAMSLAAQFERTEIRMMAQLKLAQGILEGQRKRLSRGPLD